MSPQEINETLQAAGSAPLSEEFAASVGRHIEWMAKHHAGKPITDGLDSSGSDGQRALYTAVLSFDAALACLSDPAKMLDRLEGAVMEKRQWLADAEAELAARQRIYQSAVDRKMHDFEVEHRRRDVAAKARVVAAFRGNLADAEAALASFQAQRVAA